MPRECAGEESWRLESPDASHEVEAQRVLELVQDVGRHERAARGALLNVLGEGEVQDGEAVGLGVGIGLGLRLGQDSLMYSERERCRMVRL